MARTGTRADRSSECSIAETLPVDDLAFPVGRLGFRLALPVSGGGCGIALPRRLLRIGVRLRAALPVCGSWLSFRCPSGDVDASAICPRNDWRCGYAGEESAERDSEREAHGVGDW